MDVRPERPFADLELAGLFEQRRVVRALLGLTAIEMGDLAAALLRLRVASAHG